MLAGLYFRRLFAVRLVSQTGDGIITAGVGTYVFFNASTFPNPAAGAAAFAALYVPYSLIGPFAGVFIDRWSRRQILVWSALLRSTFVVATAALMGSGRHGPPLYIAVLLILGVNRFFLSSLSAALPHVVAGDELVMANSVSPTAGGVMATIGGLVALGLNVGTGNTERGAALTLLAGGACYVAASLVAATMRRDLLGPVRAPGQPPPGRLAGELASVAAGLAAGARYVIRRRGPTAALAVTGGYSFLFGPLFLMVILLYRNYFYTSSAGTAEGHLGSMVVASGIGYFCAALVTPQATRRLSKPTWITLLVAASAVLTAALGETFIEIAYLALGFVPVPGQAGRGDLRDHDPAGRSRRRLPGPDLRLLRHDVQRHVRRRRCAERRLHAGQRPLPGHRRAGGGRIAILAAAYWLFQRTGQLPRPGPGRRPAAGAMPSAAAQRSSS